MKNEWVNLLGKTIAMRRIFLLKEKKFSLQ
jgi:hypothetical protein